MNEYNQIKVENYYESKENCEKCEEEILSKDALTVMEDGKTKHVCKECCNKYFK